MIDIDKTCPPWIDFLYKFFAFVIMFLQLFTISLGSVELGNYNSFDLYSLRCEKPWGKEIFNSTIFV
jgi:hypothetical protein